MRRRGTLIDFMWAVLALFFILGGAVVLERLFGGAL